MKTRNKKWIRFRIYAVGVFFVLALGAVLARAYQLQILDRGRLETIARNGYISAAKLPPQRGTIYDREGNALALSVEVASVYAHPALVEQKAKTAGVLAKTLNMDSDDIRQSLEDRRSFVWIKRRAPSSSGREVIGLQLEGIGVTTESRRFYPGRDIAAHLIGFTGTDNQGLEGLEKKYDELLKGPSVKLVQMRDALGRPFAVSRPVPSELGMHQLTLTIDKEIQYRAQQALEEAVAERSARGGHCLVLDPNTGAILAMAVVPTFNPNAFIHYKPHQWRNRAVTDSFEPGSALKAFLLASALEESVVSPLTLFDCEKGKYRFGGHTINDTHEYELLNVADIIIRSSNIGAVKIGQKLGYRTYVDYLQKFGFGRRTGSDLLGERAGFIRAPEKAKPIDKATVFFGQGLTVTSLQLAAAMGAIANGGKLMRPFVVKAVAEESGKTVRETSPRVARRVVSQQTAQTVTRILEKVASQEGTAPQAAIEGYRVAGKTGTAQKVDPETRAYSRTKYTAVFVGFVPVERPRMVICVVIDEPEGSAYGGVVAAPVFSEVGEWALHYLRIDPNIRTAEPGDGSVEYFNGESVENDSELLQARLDAGTIPDFSGMGMREVLRLGRFLGLKVILRGTGLAAKQLPQAGEPLEGGGTVRVHFQPPA